MARFVEGEFFALVDESPSCDVSQFSKLWEDMFLAIKKATKGKILFAGGIGSRLYNLHHEASDLDMFIVYQAPSGAFMEFGTETTGVFKNKDNQAPDYTVYELSGFCNLLLSFDTRAVELLCTASQYPEKNSALIYHISPLFMPLIKEWMQFFHAPKLAQKYLSEFQGVKGLKKIKSQYKRLQSLGGDSNEKAQLVLRIQKGLYINHRLLYQARLALCQIGQFLPFPEHPKLSNLQAFHITEPKVFSCYFVDGPIREALLEIRANRFGVSVEDHIEFLQAESDILQNGTPKDYIFGGKPNATVQNFILDLRLDLLIEEYPELDGYQFDLENIPLARAPPVDDLPDLPGELLVAFKIGRKKEGIYFSHLPLRFIGDSKKSFSSVIHGNGWTVYEIERWIEQLDKGNPNITEFVIDCCYSDYDMLWCHPQWHEFVERMKGKLITTSSLNGTFVSIQQAAKKLDRGGKLSKRKWKAQKLPPKPIEELPFPEDKLPFSKVLRFIDNLMQNTGKYGAISSQLEQINQKEDLKSIVSRIRNSESSWENILPPKISSSASNQKFLAVWTKECYIQFIKEYLHKNARV